MRFRCRSWLQASLLLCLWCCFFCALRFRFQFNLRARLEHICSNLRLPQSCPFNPSDWQIDNSFTIFLCFNFWGLNLLGRASWLFCLVACEKSSCVLCCCASWCSAMHVQLWLIEPFVACACLLVCVCVLSVVCPVCTHVPHVPWRAPCMHYYSILT